MLTHSVSLVLSSKRRQAAASNSKHLQAWSISGKTQIKGARGNLVRGFLSHFQVMKGHCRRGKRDGEFESVQLSQLEKEKNLSEQRSLHEHFEKKLNELFKDSLQLRKDYLRSKAKC